MSDRPPPGCVILLLFALALLVACGLLVSIVDGLAPHVAAAGVPVRRLQRRTVAHL